MSSFAENVNTECPICYTEIGSKNKCITECGHEFCLKCMINWSQQSVACPCCREELIETSTENDDEDIEDEDVDDDDDDDDDDDGDYDDDETSGNIEEIAALFEKKGYSIIDAISMILGRRSKTEGKDTEEYYTEMTNVFDAIVSDVDDAAERELSEREMMESEDKVVTPVC